MNATLLHTWAEEPETHRLIVGDYAGSYALGVRDDPPAFVLRVQPADIASFPRRVILHGVEVPVIVQGNFQTPRPLTSHH
jgi:hypothetical protein